MNASRMVRLLVVVLVLLGWPVGAAAKPHGEATPAMFALYAGGDVSPELRPLDPLSLADRDDIAPLDLQSRWPIVATSADGSTFVIITNESTVNDQGGLDDPAIVIRDGVNGPERARIALEGEAFSPLLSADGSRLVVSGGLACGVSGCTDQTWQVYDTTTGKVLATITGAGEPVWPNVIDPEGTRLYVPFYARPAEDSAGPWPLRIAAYDLATGEEAARMTVPDVLAGTWQAGTIDDAPLMRQLTPAIALSPDGAWIAVVDAAVTSLTLIDTGTMTVEAVHEIDRPESVAHRLARWLGLAPQEVSAKGMAGPAASAVFAADGAALYVTGSELRIGDTIESMSGEGMGVRRIDVASGQITAEVLRGQEVTQVLPAPDGNAVYALASVTPWWDSQIGASSYLLRRLDPATLKVTAERVYPQWPQVVMLASAPSG
ncbi:MAG TPA: hypothetical protein VM450_16895 [Thermomicrobiales bacterium]|nr:hypothetical protein [Thermomicrobiales bacterium]